VGSGEVGLSRITTLKSVSDTYTYSVKDPRSHKERYMRAAPMDLCSSSQNHITLGREDAEMTNRMMTTAGAPRCKHILVTEMF